MRYDQKISTDCKDNLRVVLVSTRNPLNIGASARAMANFGFSRLRVVNAYDVAFREAVSYTHLDVYKRQDQERPKRAPASGVFTAFGSPQGHGEHFRVAAR